MFDLQSIRNHFPAVMMSRGQSYYRQGKVNDCSISAHDEHNAFVIRSNVLGSGRKRYNQHITVRYQPTQETWKYSGVCSCPVGSRCKHIVAVLIAASKDAGIRQFFHDKTARVFVHRNAEQVVDWFRQMPPAKTVRDKQHITTHRNTQYAWIYRLLQDDSRQWGIKIAKIRRLKSGEYSQAAAIKIISVNNAQHELTADYIEPIDRGIVAALTLCLYSNPNKPNHSFHYYDSPATALRGEEGYTALQKLLASHRLFLSAKGYQSLSSGEPKTIAPHWHINDDGTQCLLLAPGLTLDGLIPTQPPMGICHASSTLHEL